MSALRVELVWPAEGPSMLVFHSDGVRYGFGDAVADVPCPSSGAVARAAERALIDALAWGRDPLRPPPAGWRALSGPFGPGVQ